MDLVIYNAQTKRFEIDQKKLEGISLNIQYALKKSKVIAGIPLDRHNGPGPLEEVDHCMRAIISIAEELDINIGGRWGREIDSRDEEDLEEADE